MKPAGSSQEFDARLVKSQLVRLYVKRALLEKVIQNLEHYQTWVSEQDVEQARHRRGSRKAA
jgi:hypothetical protein